MIEDVEKLYLEWLENKTYTTEELDFQSLFGYGCKDDAIGFYAGYNACINKERI